VESRQGDTARLGPYIIETELAQSGICTVYKATEPSLARPVLVKKLTARAAADPDVRKRFEREAQVCALVKHEHVVDIYSYDPDSDAPMLALEYVVGESLGELVHSRGRVPWQTVLAIAAGVLRGLDYAHSKGVLHRDIKPDNILVSHEGRVKIADFGLAIHPGAEKITLQGELVGTPVYMPPEQISGGDIDRRSDLYSLGASLYEVLTGEPPFKGANFSEILKNILNRRPDRPGLLIDDLPPEVEQIVVRLMERNPNQRFASAGQALLEVEHVAQQYNIPLDREAIRRYIGVASEPLPAAKRSPSTITRIDLKRPVSPWSIILTGVAAILLMILFAIRYKPSDTPIGGLAPGLFRVIPHPATKQEEPLRDTAQVIDNTPINVNTTTVNGPASSTSPPVEDRPVVRSEPPPVEVLEPLRPAILSLTTRPWANVTIDNIPRGATPLTGSLQLDAGNHQLVLSNPEFPTPVVLPILLESGESRRLDVNLWNYFGQVQILSVKPWAEIVIDGEVLGLTPRAKPIILPFGKHLLELRNPAHKVWRLEFTLASGDSPLQITAMLEPL